MRVARMHGYNQPLVLEDVPQLDIQPDEILVQVKAAGMCHTDVTIRPKSWRLQKQGKIRHTVKIISLDQVNETLDLLRTGNVVGRTVIKL